MTRIVMPPAAVSKKGVGVAVVVSVAASTVEPDTVYGATSAHATASPLAAFRTTIARPLTSTRLSWRST